MCQVITVSEQSTLPMPAGRALCLAKETAARRRRAQTPSRRSPMPPNAGNPRACRRAVPAGSGRATRRPRADKAEAKHHKCSAHRRPARPVAQGGKQNRQTIGVEARAHDPRAGRVLPCLFRSRMTQPGKLGWRECRTDHHGKDHGNDTAQGDHSGADPVHGTGIAVCGFHREARVQSQRLTCRQ